MDQPTHPWMDNRPVINSNRPDPYEVYGSKEFKAFCERFGIAWGLPTTKITITLDRGSPIVVQQEYIGIDINQPRNSSTRNDPSAVGGCPVLGNEAGNPHVVNKDRRDY